MIKYIFAKRIFMEYEKVKNYVGVYKKEINGVVCYYARFKFRNKLYPFINLSDKYGIRKPREAFEKIQVLKNELRQGINSFNSKLEINEPTIKNLWGNLIERKKLESSPKSPWKCSGILTRIPWISCPTTTAPCRNRWCFLPVSPTFW